MGQGNAILLFLLPEVGTGVKPWGCGMVLLVVARVSLLEKTVSCYTDNMAVEITVSFKFNEQHLPIACLHTLHNL